MTAPIPTILNRLTSVFQQLLLTRESIGVTFKFLPSKNYVA
jgi:hypothetical protein